MFIVDTHCHLDALEFDEDRDAVVQESHQMGVAAIIIPAVVRDNFQKVREVAHRYQGGFYALGIHPMYVQQSKEEDLQVLDSLVAQALAEDDKRFVALGEIGLDLFVPELKQGELLERQEFFFREQLKIAKRYDLPVLLHIRRSQDLVLKHLRQIKVRGGIAHAFNGSDQQMQHFVQMGFCLGFGGAMTYTRATRIRHLLQTVDLSHVVLETDAPDMIPSWAVASGSRNEPSYLLKIAKDVAQVRGISLEELAVATNANVCRLFPRMFESGNTKT